MLSRSLHSQRIFRNALQNYALFHFCAIHIYMDFSVFPCHLVTNPDKLTEYFPKAQALNDILQRTTGLTGLIILKEKVLMSFSPLLKKIRNITERSKI